MSRVSVGTLKLKSVSKTILLPASVLAFFVLAWFPVQNYFAPRSEMREVLNTSLFPRAVTQADFTSEAPPHSLSTIEVNLAEMELSLYKKEILVGRYEILHAPDADSSTQVPQGAYTVDQKERTKLSTVAMVRFPHFVQFGDMHALHGTPENADGVPLTTARVNGLIELSLWDAERVYAFAKEGMLVMVTTEKVLGESPVPEKLDLQYETLPVTSALAYVLTDLSTGQTLLVKNGGDRYPIASITKLVTAAVATDVIGHGAQVQAQNEHYYTLSDLYYPLLLKSDNAVAERIADHAGKNYFMSNMNAYVQVLGMEQSSFYDPSGLSPKNISSALDLSVLAQHLYKEKSFLFDITKEETMSITSTDGVLWNVKNQNKLASDPYFRGGKLGYTDEAGQTSLSVFSLPLRGEVRPIAVVVLHSKDWKQDTRTLLRWLVETTR